MISERVRERYLRDPLPIRLGGLAADLARIASCVEDPRDRDTVKSLLEEGKYFAEWAAPEASVDVQAVLAEVQVQLVLWQRRWLAGRVDPTMSDQARHWSDRILEVSGLLGRE